MTASARTADETVVTEYLELLNRGDVDRAVKMLAEEVRYINVPLAPIVGRRRVQQTLRKFADGFAVRCHSVTSNDDGVVFTERTDELSWGPVRFHFWVVGRFDIRDGEITLWQDYFDWAQVIRRALRGLVAVVIVPLRQRPI